MPPIAATHCTPAAIVVKADLRCCDVSASSPMGKVVKLPKGAVAINVNYFWKKKHIGHLIDRGAELPGIPLTKTRAILVIEGRKASIYVLPPDQPPPSKKGTLIQAGPRVIHGGRLCSYKEIAKEKFDRSVFRRTNHTMIGIDSSGKLLLGFFRGRTVMECASLLLRYGAVEALNVDGGSSSYLSYRGRYYGICNPRTTLIVRPRAPCH